MIGASDIAHLRTASIDYEETEQLKSQLAELRRQRQPFFLTADELDQILKWKLTGQYARGRAQRAANTEEVVRVVTGTALTISHPDQEYELELRVRILCALRGVGVAVASAILALVYPEEYAVIDFRTWRQLFDDEAFAPSVNKYKRYMEKVRSLAEELGWPVQEVDLAIWEYDRRHGGSTPATEDKSG